MNFTTRQVEIIEASKYLIGKKGIQNLTIKNLAKKMSFSEPALYRHFKDKTEILKALLLYHREIIKSEIIKIMDSEKSSLIKIQEIFKFKFKHIEKNPIPTQRYHTHPTRPRSKEDDEIIAQELIALGEDIDESKWEANKLAN